MLAVGCLSNMPFTEQIKLEAKRRANFSCVACKQPFVEVHHIIPEAQNGPDTLDNAAPLCGSCHDLFGGNPDKRKQIREMRDLWWEVCERRNTNPDVVALNQRLDAIQSSQISQSQYLVEIKGAFEDFYGKAHAHVTSSDTLTDLSAATGSYIPPQRDQQDSQVPPFRVEDDFRFVPESGFWIEKKTNLRVCASCILPPTRIVSPLFEGLGLDADGNDMMVWRCGRCRAEYWHETVKAP